MSASGDGHRDQKTATLAKTELFRGLDAATLERLAEIAEWRSVQAGAAIARKGDAGSHLFVIHRGHVKVGAGAADGREVTLNLLGPGAVFGEVAFADGGERTADIVATEPTELLAFARRSFLPLMQREPAVMQRVLAMLAARIRWVSQSYEDAAFLELPARLAKRLLLLAQHFGYDTPQGRALAVKLPHKEMAAHMNVTRESVNRLLQKWRQDGIIERKNGAVVLTDIARLAEFAQSE